MNVFEDLIEELKEENLLERTVIETKKYYDVTKSQTNSFSAVNNPLPQTESLTTNDLEKNDSFVAEISEKEFQSAEESILVEGGGNLEDESFEIPTESIALSKGNLETSEFAPQQLVEKLAQESLSFSEQVIQAEAELQSLEFSTPQKVALSEEQSAESETNLDQEEPEFPEYELLTKSVVEDSEFYRRRANEEVTSLQIVEHIISAIEKEQMKIVPQSYDDLGVSMALHDFLQAGNNPLSDEHTQAEFKLMQETERWYSTLAGRDKNITVGDLRRYTETAKPALSSQALISLARFYRNSPFSEVVRSKYDMVITKLVTKENWDDTRLLIFNREELVKQLEELYADWSSIPLYENKEEDSDVLIGVLKFEDFILEVNNADSLGELVKSDFFNRIRTFKESTNEKFFAPLLASAAIECNVIVGNKYVHLVTQERINHNEAEIEEKYNFLLDQPVSDTVSKTLKLVELLKEKKEPVKPAAAEQQKEIKEEIHFEKSSKAINLENDKKYKPSPIRVNKWLIAVTLLALMAMGSLYTWAEYMTPQLKASPNVRRVILDNSPAKEYFKTARINRDTYFGVTNESWEKISNEVKEDILKKVLNEGREQAYTKVHVLNSEGKMVAFASEKGVNLNPK